MTDFRSASPEDRERMERLMSAVVAKPDDVWTVKEFGLDFVTGAIGVFDSVIALSKQFGEGMDVFHEIQKDIHEALEKDSKKLGDPSFAEDIKNARAFLDRMTVNARIYKNCLSSLSHENALYIGAGDELLCRYASGDFGSADECRDILSERVNVDMQLVAHSCASFTKAIDGLAEDVRKMSDSVESCNSVLSISSTWPRSGGQPKPPKRPGGSRL